MGEGGDALAEQDNQEYKTAKMRAAKIVWNHCPNLQELRIGGKSLGGRMPQNLWMMRNADWS